MAKITIAKVEAILAKWQTKLRDKPQIVIHATYGTKTTVLPFQFAAFETVLKAHWAHLMAMPADQTWFRDQPAEYAAFRETTDRNYRFLMARNGITPPNFDGMDWKAALQDYYTLSQWIRDEGLYMQLLD